MKIVILEPLAVSKDEILKAAEPILALGHEIIIAEEKLETVEEQIAFAKDADILLIANSPLQPELVEALDQLKLISVAFTGIDHLPLELCKERKITVCNAQGYATDATAELTLALILAALRSLEAYAEAAKAGAARPNLKANTLRGKTVGIVGTGAIGLRLAELVKAFDCKLIAYSRSEKEEAKALGIKYLPLEELLKEADIVSLHLPLTEASEGLISEAELDLMKESAILVNCARGALVDNAALARALNAGKIAAAAVDVLESEPPFPKDHPLLKAEHLTITPHVAFLTEESMLDRVQIVMKNIEAWLAGEPINVKL
ncbi:MAG: NAD(P)-dependent oxidoreductase [Eubacteriales bacterium]|nr:NAD(P)-dependent oxidoreductase [Eubacteriales bacterium]